MLEEIDFMDINLARRTQEQRCRLLALNVLRRAIKDLRGAEGTAARRLLRWVESPSAEAWCDTAGVSKRALCRRAHEVIEDGA